jgi:hypothetical protein
MAELGGTFDTADVPEGDRNYDALKPGWYPAHATESDYVKKEEGVREYAKFTFEILEGVGKGRKVWINCLNMVNPSQQAQEIGRRDFAEFTKATGQGAVSNTTQLEYKPVMIKLAIDKEDAEKNVVKGFKKYDANAVQAAAPANQSAAPAASPWAKRA